MSAKLDSWSDFLKHANAARSIGDPQATKRCLETALWKAEQYGAFGDQVFEVLEQMASYYAEAGGDVKLVECSTRLIQVAARKWDQNDPHQLKYLDLLKLGLQRTRDMVPLERVLRSTIEIEEAATGKQSSAYFARVEELANFLIDMNREHEAILLRKERRAATPPKLPQAFNAPLMAERKVFVGQIITRSGLVKPDEFSKHLVFAKKIGIRIGEALISSKLVTAEQIQVALKLQIMTRNNEMTLDQAAAVLSTFASSEMTFADAMHRNGFDVEEDEADTKLGSLFVSAELLTEKELQECLRESSEKRLQLGKFLVISGKFSATLVGTALDGQEKLLAKTINRAEIVYELKRLGKEPGL